MNRRRFLKDSVICGGLMSAFGGVGSRDLLAQSAQQPANLGEINFNDAVVLAPEIISRREGKAVQVLVEEVEKCTEIRWPVVHNLASGSHPVIVVGSDQALKQLSTELPHDLVSGGKALASPDGYRLRTGTSAGSTIILVSAAGERGVLFGVGGLLRSLRMSKRQVGLSGPLDVATSPKYRLRGHQLGYRPKTNAYDGWSVPMWDQYYRDLAVFGTNAVELIPPRSDDEPNSPHFSLPQLQMMVQMSKLADEYGLDLWIWYPAMDRDYSNPDTVEFAINQWGEVFKALPRIDVVFVPGGDPGHTEPKYLMALLEKQTQNLHRYHPHAEMWMSPQSFDKAWMDEFFGIMDREPPWLSGVVYGPQMRFEVSVLRQRLPKRYPIRLYPDITHSLDCQFPVPDWDLAYALTEGREVINPRPIDYANIFRLQAPYSIGFLSYSEGCNDDVNKMLWSSLAWDPERPIIEILREYSGYFISDRLRDDFAQGLLSLEANWRGPLLQNGSVETTLEQFQDMEATATPQELENWRFQMGLYRAYFDAFVRRRLLIETAAQEKAMAVLGEIRRMGVRPKPLGVGGRFVEPTSELDLSVLLDQAEQYLNGPLTDSSPQVLRTRIHELGEALFQSIHMQLAVELYQGEAVERAANLDTLDAPLNDAPWLRQQFAEIRKLASRPQPTPSVPLEAQQAPDKSLPEAMRNRMSAYRALFEEMRKKVAAYEAHYQAIAALVDRTDPGPGGFYDNVGDLARQPHLVLGLGAKGDPEFRQSALFGRGYPWWPGLSAPLAWWCYGESMFDEPLQMHYDHLDRTAQYKVRVVYIGSPGSKVQLDCNGNYPVHPLMNKPWPPKPVEFDIPPEATATGALTLIWHREQGLGGAGRGCEVAEVWLMKK
jgi:hypothetical protein